MATFWLAKTKAEIQAIPAIERTDYCRIFCIEWLEWCFYHPSYGIASTIDMTTKYANGYDDFMFVPTDGNGAWLRDTQNIFISTLIDENCYKPPSFRPYKHGQCVTLGNLTSEIQDTNDNKFKLINAPFCCWVAASVPTTNTYNVDDVWIFNNAATIVSDENPRIFEIWGAGGVFWFQKNERKLFINEALPKTTETNGVTLWNEVTFNNASRY